MNGRIRELAYEADEYATNIETQGGKYHQAYTQKLAELIVDECVSIVNAGKIVWVSTDVPISGEVALDLCAKDIKAYFGVKQ